MKRAIAGWLLGSLLASPALAVTPPFAPNQLTPADIMIMRALGGSRGSRGGVKTGIPNPIIDATPGAMNPWYYEEPVTPAPQNTRKKPTVDKKALAEQRKAALKAEQQKKLADRKAKAEEAAREKAEKKAKAKQADENTDGDTDQTADKTAT